MSNDAFELLKQLREAKTSRISVYLNAKRVDELYRQKVARIDKIILSQELGPEFTAGLGLIGIKLSGTKAHSSEYEFDATDKALLIENLAEREGQLYQPRMVNNQIPNGALVQCLGDSRVISDNEEVNQESCGLPIEMTTALYQRRAAQAKGSKLGTIVLVSKYSERSLAAIAYVESVVDIGHIYSYSKGRYGVLGRKESEIGDLFFVAPIWIWYEQEQEDTDP